MGNIEGLDDVHSPPAAVPPREDRVELPESPLSLDTAACFESGCSEPDCSDRILHAAVNSPLVVDKDDGIDRHLATNGSNELSEMPAERRNSSVAVHAFVESSMVSANGCEGNGCLKKRMAETISGDGAVSAVEESEQREAQRFLVAAAAVRHIGFQVTENSDTPDELPSMSALGGTSSSVNGANSIRPSGSQQMQAASDDEATKSPVTSNDVRGTEPPFRTPTNGGKLTSAAFTVGSSGSSHGLVADEVAFLSDKLVHIESRTQARVMESSGTDLKKIEEAKQNLDTLCRADTRCGQKAVKLRRQRDQARERAQRLEKEISLLRDLYAGDFEFLTEKVKNFKKKNSRLSLVNTQQLRFIQEHLSRQSHSCLSDVIYFQLELKMEAERLRQELVRKEEEVRSLDMAFHCFRNASEKNYLAAIDDIMDRNTMLQRVTHSLEAEVDVVSSCPALMQLQRSLNGEGATQEETTSSSGRHRSAPSGAKLANHKAPSAI